jgi:hypothetical protein
VAREKRIAVDIVAGMDEEVIELTERLELGDEESVWGWLEHHYPKVMGPVHRRQLWREWVSAVRDLYEWERGERQ